MLIVLEGIDGCGKSTVQKGLAEVLRNEGYSVRCLAEPTDGQYGQEIRKRAARHDRPDPERELELFILDRREDVDKNILPALERGEIVIMDRYYISTAAYQGARGLDVDRIISLNEEFAPRPDLLIILDIDPEISLARAGARGELDGFEKKDYLAKVREIYLSLADRYNTAVVDASREREEVLGDVVAAVREALAESGCCVG